ncbi:hypothetical protein BDY19DRAFT_988105 [Irpex rosettiformis]|uniref:Uncharacterized protein n=1 Tax=Irpex rosettiformis TaxID=378272 RepID=A0ACB8UIP0_9APHY|nr:hypothetical protein BDY19DRAFT_988105 [Irpex rosettiformis]
MRERLCTRHSSPRPWAEDNIGTALMLERRVVGHHADYPSGVAFSGEIFSQHNKRIATVLPLPLQTTSTHPPADYFHTATTTLSPHELPPCRFYDTSNSRRQRSALAKYESLITCKIAVEELTAVTIICSDKTSILTVNRLTVDRTTLKTYASFSQDVIILLAAYASYTENQDAIVLRVVDSTGYPSRARAGIKLLTSSPSGLTKNSLWSQLLLFSMTIAPYTSMALTLP